MTVIRMFTRSPAEAVELLDEAFDRGDLEAVLEFYEDGAVLVVEQERLATGKEEIRAVYRWIFASIKGAARQGETYVIEAGDIALLTSKWNISYMTAGGDFVSRESFASVIMRASPDVGWRIVVDHSWSRDVLC
jgi:ketosteroid isomerase-like protein